MSTYPWVGYLQNIGVWPKGQAPGLQSEVAGAEEVQRPHPSIVDTYDQGDFTGDNGREMITHADPYQQSGTAGAAEVTRPEPFIQSIAHRLRGLLRQEGTTVYDLVAPKILDDPWVDFGAALEEAGLHMYETRDRTMVFDAPPRFWPNMNDVDQWFGPFPLIAMRLPIPPAEQNLVDLSESGFLPDEIQAGAPQLPSYLYNMHGFLDDPTMGSVAMGD